MGGQLSVVFAAGRIEVAWEQAAAEAPAMVSIGPLLQQRRFAEARPLLETLLQLQPENPEALYNLGVLASEEGQLEEARLLLRRAVVANAGDTHAQANAQVALGLAALRQEDRSEARQALEAAIDLEPRNAFALRSLGSLLVIAGALAAGIERFRQALAVAPDDLVTTFNLAQALLELDPGEHRNEADGALFKISDDPRVTKVGKFLRRFSIDELPQLFNVMRGNMSLVGPRPLPERDYQLLDDLHRKRYLVLPGMTGLWQVSGRSDLSFDELVRLDFYYIETWSIWLDLVILVRTIPAVLFKRGAY
jgi:tetratricopeptide (TPR) repeat protein